MANELTVLRIGADRFQAQLVVEACRAEGLRVELLGGDDSGVDPFLGLVQGHRLLVRETDVERVQEIIARQWGPGGEDGHHP